jgi:hypothetical protein
MDEFFEVIEAQLVVWEKLSVERRIAYIRTVQAVKILCQRTMQEIEFGRRTQRMLSVLQEVCAASTLVKVHWIEKGDGTKWLYFCQADNVPECGRCPKRIECLTRS